MSAAYIQMHFRQIFIIEAKTMNPGLEVIKLEYSLKLKIKRNDWLLADTYFEFENELKFYNLEARSFGWT